MHSASLHILIFLGIWLIKKKQKRFEHKTNYDLNLYPTILTVMTDAQRTATVSQVSHIVSPVLHSASLHH